jgi:hypothetical protein
MVKAQEGAASIAAAVKAGKPPWPPEVQAYVDAGYPTPVRTPRGNWEIGSITISPAGDHLTI